jgi:hypothetical protein
MAISDFIPFVAFLMKYAGIYWFYIPNSEIATYSSMWLPLELSNLEIPKLKQF